MPSVSLSLAPSVRCPTRRRHNLPRLFAVLIALVASAVPVHAEELLTPSFEDRRDQPVGPFVGKQRSTVETLVQAFERGQIQVIGNKGGPLQFAKLPKGVQRRLKARFRAFARAIVPVKRRPSRAVVRELISDPRVAEIAPFEFDAETGTVTVHLKEELWKADTAFNAYQLGAAVQLSGHYVFARPESLEP